MASDVIESEAALKGVTLSDTSVNNSSPDFVTPRRTGEDLVNRQTSSPSSSGVSGEGDEEELEELQSSAVSTFENGEEALQESLTQTRGTPQERTTPDNEQKTSEARSSTPVSLPHPHSSSGPIGSLERQESVATTEARLRMEGVELKEEWQDEDFPRPLPEEEELEDELFAGTSGEGDHGYAVNHDKKAKKKLTAPDISLTLDRSEGSLLSDELDESTELDLDDIDTPSDNSNEFEWEELFPFMVWKKASNRFQQQVSVFLVVRSVGQSFYFLPTMTQSMPIVLIIILFSQITRCFIPLYLLLCMAFHFLESIL